MAAHRWYRDEIFHWRAALDGPGVEYYQQRVRKVVPLLLVILGYFGALLVLGSIAGTSLHKSWRFAGVTVLPRPFTDLYAISLAAESGLSYETLTTTAFDPDRLDPLNYPRLWVILGRTFGLRSRYNTAYGCILAIAFFGAALFLMKDVKGRLGWLAPVLICSPSVMLGVERGNCDLGIFCLIVIGLWLSSARSASATVAGFASFLLACVLKLYPLAALPAFIRRSRLGAVAVLTIFAAYVMMTAADIRAIFAANQMSFRISYGCRVLGDSWLNAEKHLFPQVGLSQLHPAFLHQLGTVLAAALGGLCVVYGWRRDDFIPAPAPASERADDRSATFARTSFLAGSSIYAATFLAGGNWDYRLVFLLLTVPQIVLWGGKIDRRWIYGAIGPLVIVCWADIVGTNFPGDRWLPLRGLVVVLNGLTQWVLLAILVTASAALFRSELKASGAD